MKIEISCRTRGPLGDCAQFSVGGRWWKTPWVSEMRCGPWEIASEVSVSDDSGRIHTAAEIEVATPALLAVQAAEADAAKAETALHQLEKIKNAANEDKQRSGVIGAFYWISGDTKRRLARESRHSARLMEWGQPFILVADAHVSWRGPTFGTLKAGTRVRIRREYNGSAKFHMEVV